MMRFVPGEGKTINVVSSPEVSLIVTEMGLISVSACPKRITLISGRELLADGGSRTYTWSCEGKSETSGVSG